MLERLEQLASLSADEAKRLIHEGKLSLDGLDISALEAHTKLVQAEGLATKPYRQRYFKAVKSATVRNILQLH